MRIFSGIDEAGLGPKVGSLFVVGVDVLGVPKVKESKEIFRRNIKGYRFAESIVMSCFRDLGMEFKNAYELFKGFFGEAEDFLKEVRIPAFDGEILDLDFKVLNVLAIRVKACDLRANRFRKDAETICRLAVKLKGEEVICGLAGGYRNYDEFLNGTNKNVKFFKKADKKFPQVALASIFAKYMRELEVLGLNSLLGFKDRIPRFSGYPSDKKTRDFIRMLVEMNLMNFLR